MESMLTAWTVYLEYVMKRLVSQSMSWMVGMGGSALELLSTIVWWVFWVAGWVVILIAGSHRTKQWLKAWGNFKCPSARVVSKFHFI